MGSSPHGIVTSSKTGASSSSMRPAVWAAGVLALCLLLSRCSPCEGRELMMAVVIEEEAGNKAMYFEGGLVLRAPPPPSGGGEEAVPKGFTARAERLMRSVPSPGVGH